MATMVRCKSKDWRYNIINCVEMSHEEEDLEDDITKREGTQLVPIPRLFSWSKLLTNFYVTQIYVYRKVNIDFKSKK